MLARPFALLLVVAGLVGAGAASAPTPGTGLWSTGASLITGRERHTATLLRDGRVLVVGGTNGRNTALASAEIYDPHTNRWTPAGSMATTRIDHTATRLPSGKVLVAGGLAEPVPSGTLATAELYDPSTNTWSSAMPMIGARARHTATLLGDGRVLVVGGASFTVHDNGVFSTQLADAEIYDPAANRWSVTSPMRFYRVDHSATLLTDGRVLVAGGSDGNDPTPFAAAEVYDPTQARWIDAGSMSAGRSGHGATLLADGDVLVIGGLGFDSNALPITLRDVEFYHPPLNVWAGLSSTTEVHSGHTVTLLRNGKVLVNRLDGPESTRDLRSGPQPLVRQRPNECALQPDRHAPGRWPGAGGGRLRLDSLATALLYDPNGVAPIPSRRLDPLVVATLLLIGGVIVAAVAWSIPPVRRRLRRLRPTADSDEWIP